jgi:serine/threonine protein kinase
LVLKNIHRVLQAERRLRDRYEIQAVLGRGGMGQVYLALDRALGGKRVAVKEMSVSHRAPREREEAFAAFRQEAHLLASLDHPRLVPVTDFFEESATAFLVMGYVQGANLEAVLRARPVRQGEVLDWIDQICDVLNYLHTHDPPVLFHDLKPSNVMLDDRDRIRLIDFGIARTLEGPGAIPRGAGTTEFSPLEQFSESGTDARSDIYALGATMYALLTRTTPPAAVQIMAGDAALPAPRAINPDISPEIEGVILKAMALDRNERYRSAVEMRSALSVARHAAVARQRPSEEILVSRARYESAGSIETFSSPDREPGEAASSPPVQRALRRSLSLGVVVAIVALGLLGWLLHPRSEPIPVSGGQEVGRTPVLPLLLASKPSGATAWLDGRRLPGVTPLMVPDLPLGSHRVRLQRGQSGAEARIRLTAGSGPTVEVEHASGPAQVRARAAELRLTLTARP